MAAKTANKNHVYKFQLFILPEGSSTTASRRQLLKGLEGGVRCLAEFHKVWRSRIGTLAEHLGLSQKKQ